MMWKEAVVAYSEVLLPAGTDTTKNLVNIVRLWSEIWTRYLKNTNQEWHPLDCL
jgi:hypothetical protein